MTQAEENDELLLRYLLGELSEERQEGVEQRYISDPAFYDQLLAVEDDLIDAYAEGELSQSRRASFENHFLRSPERQARVRFAKAWIAYASRQTKTNPAELPRPRRNPFDLFRFGTWPAPLRAMFVLLVIIGPGVLIVETLRLRNRVEQSESQRAELEKNQRQLEQQMDEERRRSQELSTELERERSARDQQSIGAQQTSPNLVSFILTPGLVRGAADAKRLVISPETREVSLQIRVVQGDYESYSVAIKTVEGRPVWSRAELKAQSTSAGKVVVVRAPAGLFATEDYILTLSGPAGSSEPLYEYSFSVLKK